MNNLRCPGQNMQFWKPEDIFTIPCPHCRADLEFWKDEPVLVCQSCKNEVGNPRLNLACAKWCKHGKECLEKNNTKKG